MMGWLFARRGALMLGGILALCLTLFALDRCAKHFVSGIRESATEAGVLLERTSGLESTVNRMETADETRLEIRNDRSRARYDECVQSARDAKNCVRFLPE